jgi:hypothetical protein
MNSWKYILLTFTGSCFTECIKVGRYYYQVGPARDTNICFKFSLRVILTVENYTLTFTGSYFTECSKVGRSYYQVGPAHDTNICFKFSLRIILTVENCTLTFTGSCFTECSKVGRSYYQVGPARDTNICFKFSLRIILTVENYTINLTYNFLLVWRLLHTEVIKMTQMTKSNKLTNKKKKICDLTRKCIYYFQTRNITLFYNHRAILTIIVKSPTECSIYFKRHYTVSS